MTGLKILLVDDNRDDVFLSVRALAKLDLTDVNVAYDGREALQYLFGNHLAPTARVVNKPDIILLDQRMPVLDGLEFMELAHSVLLSEGIPVVVITSSPLDREKQRFYEFGVKDYLAKPVNVEAMSRALKSVYQ